MYIIIPYVFEPVSEILPYVPSIVNGRKNLGFCELHYSNALMFYANGRMTGFDT